METDEKILKTRFTRAEAAAISKTPEEEHNIPYFISKIIEDNGDWVVDDIMLLDKGDNNMSFRLAKAIYLSFPFINPYWLYAGLGDSTLGNLGGTFREKVWRANNSAARQDLPFMEFTGNDQVILSDGKPQHYTWDAQTHILRFDDRTYLVCSLAWNEMVLMDTNVDNPFNAFKVYKQTATRM